MDLQIRGRVALVTGASAGIGAACALALAAEGVRVAVAARRGTLLERVARALYADEDAMRAGIPMGRVGTPDELAAAATFLCGTGAAFITGQTLAVDGGMTRALF